MPFGRPAGSQFGFMTPQVQALQSKRRATTARADTRSRSARGGIDYSLYADTQKREADALAANVGRETEIRGIYDQLISRDQGAFRTAGLADIERSKTRAIGTGTQQLISSGLYGTTTAGAIPVQAEGRAAQSRLRLEDIIQQRQAELKLGKAGFVERIEDPYPDYSLLVQAMAAGASR